MRLFLFGYHISFYYFFTLEVARDPYFYVYMKMFQDRFHTSAQMDKKVQSNRVAYADDAPPPH